MPKIQNLVASDAPEGAKSKIQNHTAAVLILLAFIILAVIYSLATPPLEAGDESRHYAVVKYMADTGRLPVQDGSEAQIHWSHEGNQPPLYYALAAALTFWIDTGAWNDVFWYNPHTTIGDPLRPDNKNITLHRPNEAWQGHVLAVHLIRFLSISMAVVTVTAAYFIALHLFRGNRWLAAGAMAVTAFNPMFLFISAAVNNDNAVIMFVTLALWLMIRMSEWANRRMGKINQDNSQFIIHNSQFTIYLPAALLGLLIGLGALSKLYALGLLPLAGLLFLWLAYQNDRRPETGDRGLISHAPRATHHASRIILHAFTWTALTLLVTLLVAGWFYWRNALLYGDPLALQVMRETAGQRSEAPTLATLAAEFEGFRIAYWALFGGVNILADTWIYRVLDGVSLIAALGVIAFILRFTIYDLRFTIGAIGQNLRLDRTRHDTLPISLPAFTLLLAWFGIMALGFIVWNLTQPAGQGRLFYPAIAAISALSILGLTWWLPASVQKIVIVVCTLSLLIFAIVSPIFYIVDAYTKPPILTEKELPADLQPLNFTYDGKMRLLGYQLHTPVVHPAETLALTLYWQLLEPVELNYSIFIHLLGRQRQVVGQIDTYPGGGHWPTTLLPSGAILADDYAVPISPEAETKHAPTRLLIAAGIYDFNEPGRPGKPAVNAAGQPVESIIASAKLIPWQWPSPPRFDPPINFADKVTLLSYQIAADQQSLTLNWQAEAPLDLDYTVFLQLWRAAPQANSAGTGAEAEYVTGFDGPPVQGDYPTSLWSPGDIIVDTHPLDLTTLPAGDYYLLAGLYNPTTGERLPAATLTGLLPDYAVNLGPIRVTK
ncbi:MAG: glycosyltransferase family 39 protein [Anaerolineae bacterium]|nr:glycosyltransferase family 39 protein [Anaerolineae bacterium]